MKSLDTLKPLINNLLSKMWINKNTIESMEFEIFKELNISKKFDKTLWEIYVQDKYQLANARIDGYLPL